MVGAIIRIREMLNCVSICEQSFQRNVIEVFVSRGTGGRTQRFIVISPALQTSQFLIVEIHSLSVCLNCYFFDGAQESHPKKVTIQNDRFSRPFRLIFCDFERFCHATTLTTTQHPSKTSRKIVNLNCNFFSMAPEAQDVNQFISRRRRMWITLPAGD